MKNDGTPPDNGASYMGVYGLKNELVCWLIGRGAGELVGLRPDEMLAPMTPPRCPHEDHDDSTPLLYRPPWWKCYRHREIVAVPMDARVQEIPPFRGNVWTALNKQVDLVYSKEPWEKSPTWKYVLS